MKKVIFLGIKPRGLLLLGMKEDQNTSGNQGHTGSAKVVYPLLLNYGLSAVGVDSFDALLKYGRTLASISHSRTTCQGSPLFMPSSNLTQTSDPAVSTTQENCIDGRIWKR